MYQWGLNMNFYKELFYILFEMFFSVFIIIFGYFIWDNFDKTEYQIAKYYDNIKTVELVYESNIDKGIQNNNTVVSVHNISNKINAKDIILKINKNNKLDDIKLDINKKNYSLDDLYIREDNIYNYYLIENINLIGYETKTYYIDFELNNDNLLYDYEFITEL